MRMEIEAAIAGALRVAPYSDEHFVPGQRVSLPSSWRRLLSLMNAGKCTWCHRAIGHAGFHVDHGRPLHPDQDQCRPTPSGNSNLLNLAALCAGCNLDKSNRTDWFPESLIPSLVSDRTVADYFSASLRVPPSLAQHRLPKGPARPDSNT